MFSPTAQPRYIYIYWMFHGMGRNVLNANTCSFLPRCQWGSFAVFHQSFIPTPLNTHSKHLSTHCYTRQRLRSQQTCPPMRPQAIQSLFPVTYTARVSPSKTKHSKNKAPHLNGPTIVHVVNMLTCTLAQWTPAHHRKAPLLELIHSEDLALYSLPHTRKTKRVGPAK